jgi:hypothetical protein
MGDPAVTISDVVIVVFGKESDFRPSQGVANAVPRIATAMLLIMDVEPPLDAGTIPRSPAKTTFFTGGTAALRLKNK